MTQEPATLDFLGLDMEKLTKFTDKAHKELKHKIGNLADDRKAVLIKAENNTKDIPILKDFISKQTRAKNINIFGFNNNSDESENIWVKIKDLFLQVKLEIPNIAFEGIFKVGKTRTCAQC